MSHHYLIEVTQTNTAIVYRTSDGHIEPGVTGPHANLDAAKAVLPDGAVYSVCQVEPEPRVIANRYGKYSGGVIIRKQSRL